MKRSQDIKQQRDKKIIPHVLLFLLLLLGLRCKETVFQNINPSDYTLFYNITQGIRRRETESLFMVEQRVDLDDKYSLVIIGYADEQLKNPNPKNRMELLENIIIDMVNDSQTLYYYNQSHIDRFLDGVLSEDGLKDSLVIAGERDLAVKNGESDPTRSRLKTQALFEFNQYRKEQNKFAMYAKTIKQVFTDDPLKLDYIFCKDNNYLKEGNGILTQPGVPYRMIGRTEYQYLNKMRYPFLDFLLREGNSRIFNALPNCAQGATQLLSGYALYTKASQLAKDEGGYFQKLNNLNQIQPGDLVLVVWDYLADAQTNSGHVGVVVDIDFDQGGEICDATLIEFFPANHAPRLVKISESMYGNWQGQFKTSEKNDQDIFFIRLKRTTLTDAFSKPENLIEFLKLYYSESKCHILL
jgi:hypothetical protein